MKKGFDERWGKAVWWHEALITRGRRERERERGHFCYMVERKYFIFFKKLRELQGRLWLAG